MARTKGSKTHCSQCGGEGHTKRTCPELGRAKHQRINEPRTKKTYCKHCGSRFHSSRECPVKPVRSPRRDVTCSYCSKSGHTRRSCELLKKDRAQVVKENAAFRAKVLDWINEIGLGVGALVKGTRRFYDSESGRALTAPGLFLVTDIRWERLNVVQSYEDRQDCYHWTWRCSNWWDHQNCLESVLKVQLVGTPRVAYSWGGLEHVESYKKLPSFCEHIKYQTYGENLEIVSKAPNKAKPPADFLDGTSGIDGLFARTR